ncbi:hypothetical protein [Agromyces sp. M3QZ16-3]|uniref:hypothetical protein n=1 Tax=Agromyces sp. M3QZ16-3 TaxID=3447585 RepID=UPI003F6937F4
MSTHQLRINSATTGERGVGRRRVAVLAAALAASWVAMVIHNQAELPITLLDLENTGPLAVDVALLALCWRWPASRIAWSVVLAWALLNLVVGGLVTVLPLAVLPFAPEQTVEHYLMHVVYAIGQIPLVVVAVIALRGAASGHSAEGGVQG